jgi:hypothetical protein
MPENTTRMLRRASRFAVLPLVLLQARAADAPLVQSTSGAGMAFARYVARLGAASAWTTETVEIDASLPHLAMHGRLRAIRRLLPHGKPEYQVLEVAGDQTVKQQVIARYLSAEVRASELPASSVALSPANYKFRYQGFAAIAGAMVYVYQITPRKKREGLIKGELWLDAETGAAIRQSGYLVKSPSIFVKRVDITRETRLRGGLGAERVTHLSVNTRLVGRAELTIVERPAPGAEEY